MAALQCEICGGKLIGRPGGIFECDSCGMEYDTAWAKEKIQEIKGTVKVEGTVQIAGTVTVEGSINIENYLKRGRLALGNGNWEAAKKHFDEALNFDAECVEAYLGNCCAHYRNADIHSVITQIGKLLLSNVDFKNAIQFMEPSVLGQFQLELEAAETHFTELKKQQEERRQAEKQREEAEKYRELEEKRQAQELEQKCRADFLLMLKEKRETMKLAGKMISCGQKHVVALKSDGTVMAVGDNSEGQCNVKGWRDIVAIYAGPWFTVGLKSNGYVVAVGMNADGQCNVKGWRDITSISVNSSHVVGLKSDGTVVATGYNKHGECNVGSWRNIVAVFAGYGFTLGLKSDGTVKAVGVKDDNTFAAKDWHNIVDLRIVPYSVIGMRSDGSVAVAGSLLKSQPGLHQWKDIIVIDSATHVRGMKASDFTLGVRSDGTVLAVGDYKNEDEWTEILTASAYGFYTVGLKQDGTVKAKSYSEYAPRGMEGWRDIVAISTSDHCVAGLKSDGRVVIAGSIEGKENVGYWRLFQSIDNLKQDLKEAQDRRQMERTARKAALEKERTALQAELPNLKGLFTGKRRREIESRLAEIEAELKGMN